MNPRRIQIEEPERLQQFMNSFSQHSEDFKALVLKLIQSGKSVEEVATFTGVPATTLYQWVQQWNKKKNQA